MLLEIIFQIKNARHVQFNVLHVILQPYVVLVQRDSTYKEQLVSLYAKMASTETPIVIDVSLVVPNVVSVPHQDLINV